MSRPFNLLEELYIAVFTMDANGMSVLLHVDPQDTKAASQAAWKWANETVGLLRNRSILQWRLFIEIITSPTSDVRRRVGHRDIDLRAAALEYLHDAG